MEELIKTQEKINNQTTVTLKLISEALQQHKKSIELLTKSTACLFEMIEEIIARDIQTPVSENPLVEAIKES